MLSSFPFFIEGDVNIFLYNIYVDDKHKASLNSKVKCTALVEGVKATRPHRLVVTAVSSSGELSNDRLQVCNLSMKVPPHGSECTTVRVSISISISTLHYYYLFILFLYTYRWRATVSIDEVISASDPCLVRIRVHS